MSAEDDLQLPDGLDDDFEDLGDFGDDLGDLGGDLADFDNAPPVEEETKGVSRFQMIEYLNQREWPGTERSQPSQHASRATSRT